MLPYAYDTDGLLSDKELGRGNRKKRQNKPFSFDEDSDNTVQNKRSKQSSKSSVKQQLRDKPLPPPPSCTRQAQGDKLIAMLQKKRLMNESTATSPAASSHSKQNSTKRFENPSSKPNNSKSSVAGVFTACAALCFLSNFTIT